MSESRGIETAVRPKGPQPKKLHSITVVTQGAGLDEIVHDVDVMFRGLVEVAQREGVTIDLDTVQWSTRIGDTSAFNNRALPDRIQVDALTEELFS